jgi:hypothetical protein
MSAVSGSRVFSQHDRDRDLNAHGAFLVFYDSNPETTGIFFCCGRHRDPAPFILSFIEDAFPGSCWMLIKQKPYNKPRHCVSVDVSLR